MASISFIISSRGKYAKLFKTFASLSSQTSQDFKIIVVTDKINDVYEDKQRLFQYFKQNDNFTVVFNSKIQGTSADWNTAIQLVETDYFTFIKEGDEANKDYVEQFNKLINDQGELDIIEHEINLTKLINDTSVTYLNKNVIYDLSKDYSPFAYASYWTYNKIFRTKLINDSKISFRNFVRFDSLFFYKALVNASNYYYSDKIISTHILSPIKYSAFDLLNQWPHIFNYYRRISMYKRVANELQYAYFKTMIHNYLWLIEKFDNKVLTKKTVNFIEHKVTNHINEFKKNPVFINSPDERFKEIINNSKDYFKKILKDIK